MLQAHDNINEEGYVQKLLIINKASIEALYTKRHCYNGICCKN